MVRSPRCCHSSIPSSFLTTRGSITASISGGIGVAITLDSSTAASSLISGKGEPRHCAMNHRHATLLPTSLHAAGPPGCTVVKVCSPTSTASCSGGDIRSENSVTVSRSAFQVSRYDPFSTMVMALPWAW